MIELHVGGEDDFSEGRCRLVSSGGREIGVRSYRGELYAYENVCLHQGGPVCEGVTVGRVSERIGEGGEVGEACFSEEKIHLVCPWHGYEYDLVTGTLATDPRRGLRRYEVVRREGQVYVRVG